MLKTAAPKARDPASPPEKSEPTLTYSTTTTPTSSPDTSATTPKANNTSTLEHPALDTSPVNSVAAKGASTKKRGGGRRVSPMMSTEPEASKSTETQQQQRPPEKAAVSAEPQPVQPHPPEPQQPVHQPPPAALGVPPPAPASSARHHHHHHRRTRSQEQYYDVERGEGGGYYGPPQQAPPLYPGQPQQRHSSERGHHRRSRSHEMNVPPTDPYYAAAEGGAYYGPPVPPQQRVPPRFQSPSPQQHPPPQEQHRRSRNRHRVQSLPNDPRHPSPFFSPPTGSSRVMNPVYYQEGSETVPMPHPSAGYTRGPPRTQGDSHRRSNSFDIPPGYAMEEQQRRHRASSYDYAAYGSFEGYSGGAPPTMAPPPPPRPASLQHPGHFSPRDEFRNLTTGFSPSSLSPRATQSERSPRLGGRQCYARTPYNSERHISFSPDMQQPQLLRDSLRLSGSDFATTPEGAFQAQRRGSGKHSSSSGGGHRRQRSAQSMRKMHMRQQSAQLFMEDIKGVPQPLVCRNVLFTLLFVFHLIGMMYLGSTYSKDAIMMNQVSGTTVNVWYRNVIFVAFLCGIFAVVISTVALIIMTVIVRRMVQVALFLTIALSFAWGTIGIGLSPKNFVPITGIIALAFSVGYTFVVWDRIPFAAANLHAALQAVRENVGTVFVAFFFQFVALVWSIYYTFVVIGVYDAITTGQLKLSHQLTIFVYVMLGISYYWTYQVLLNIVQVTVASTIGKWWFRPDGAKTTCCDSTVKESFFHAIFYEFGSICFGSLLVGPVRFIRQLSAFVRPSQDDQILLCLHEFTNCIQQCIAGCVDALSDHFNPWALTYVGLYGYGLLDAGHNATALFQKRGWTVIVSDDLVPNVLLMVSLVIAGVTGMFGSLIQELDGLDISNLDSPYVFSFVIGCYMGLIVTSVLFGIISSSVNAVIVCFAGSPFEFEKNHPALSAEMRAAWRDVWPGCMDVVDLRLQQNMHEVAVLANETTPMLMHGSSSMSSN